MSLFTDLLQKIFPAGHPAVTANAAQAGPPNATATTSSPTAPQRAGTAVVDVEQILNGMAQRNPEKLNWKTSIVDLLKLVGLDSSLTARKQLAQELQYAGDPNDSAAMNIWLHKQVMRKIAENGGKVPDDLKS